MFAVGRHVAKLTGYAPELPTPFNDDDRVDYETFEWLCELQIMHGATALVVGGTTAEPWTLSSAEHAELIRIAAGLVRGRLPVVAGVGSNATADAVALGKVAEANGADAILSVSPYYNKPTQDGLCAGCISVVANIAPGLCQRMYLAWRQGHVMRARRNMIPVAQLAAALAREANPAPLKYALSLCGLMPPRVRLPLVEVTEETRREISGALHAFWRKYSDFMIERLLVAAKPSAAAL